ncbi:hypothetical protein V494_04370 [Pseudogymnoascus sp. VKM F-4513 (FW-928)]|nr:hypothetical protein V494_04370 [Pseudogymnoascus sp. VKM F-4513 (FW-928)]
MSLNGLDDLKVKEAHDAAIAEPGGWFLLKYVTRDEIDVLGRGSGGILEIRNAIASYDEPSPLFGFLKYRRRNVLIKYVPEGTSRLIQARVTVHFNAITDRFSPYDTSFSIDTAKGLKDSALSAACSLHTASGSTSSSTSSLRRRRLMEIAEDEEEDRRQSTVLEERASTIRASSVDGYPTEDESPSTEPPELLTSMTYNPKDSETTTEQDSESLDLTPSISADPSVQSSVDHTPESPRQSTDEGRPSMQDGSSEFSNYSSYPAPGRPKVKLGPRPSLDTAGRPQTSSSANYRQVSTLPANVKLFSRSSKRPKERPQSQLPVVNPTMMVSPPQLGDPTANPDDQVVRPNTSGGRPTTSSGASFISTMSANTVTSKMPTMTPEKARLMKAMEMRKKKRNALQQKNLAPPASEVVGEAEKTAEPTPTVEPAVEPVVATDPIPVEPASTVEAPTVEPITSAEPTPAVAEELREEETTPTLPNDTKEEPESILAASTTSSANESDVTANGSGLITPLTVSEPTESTRASSVSDSTDETIQASTATKEASPVEDVSQSDDTASPDNGPESDLVEQTSSEVPTELSNAVFVPEKETTTEAEQPPVVVPETPKTEEPEVPTVVVPEVPEEVPVVEEAPVVSDLQTEQAESTVVADSHPEPVPKELVPEVGASEDRPPSALITDIATEISAMPVQVDEVEDAEPKVVVSEDLGDENLPEVRGPMKIPRSKFSSQAPAEPATPEPDNGTLAPQTNGDERASRSESPKRRRALMEPIRTDLAMSRPASGVDFLNDDAFMDELQSATVQEAKPISVAKSPMSPAFPRDAKRGPSVTDRFSRAFSNPSKKDNQLLTPQSQEPARSVSAGSAYLNRISQQSSSSPVIKKVNVGSGISQRIKALEKLSSTTGTPVAPQGTGPAVGSAPTFFAVRKSHSAGGSKSPSIAERANSLTRHSPSPSMSRESSPEQFKNRDRSYSIKNRQDAFNSSPTNTQTRARPESISVTARIIRDPNHPFPTKSDAPSDYNTLSLKQSPLVIDHQKFKPAPVQLPMKETIENRELPATPAKKERRSSITVVKELLSETRNSFAERRKSMTIDPSVISSAMSMRSPSRPSSIHQGSTGRPLSISSRRSSRDYGNVMSSTSSILSPSTSEENVEKKASRASRMLHRMSSSFSSSRKTITHAMSPTVREESEPPATGVSMTPSNYSSMSGPATTMVEMGDVNVQFPDNLLWKRRAMRLDSQGYLILTQSQAGKTTDKAAGVKKYHLSDFRTPAIPDMEAEELPNSVVLDFVDGSGLQFACEDRGGQVWVLQKLLEAHSTWAAYGQ